MWNGFVLAEVYPYVGLAYLTGREVDQVLRDEQITKVEVAEAVSSALAQFGLSLPDEDGALLVRLRRDGARPGAMDLGACVCVLQDGRLGLTTGDGRVIETAGDELAYVAHPEPGRYSQVLKVPGVYYGEVV
ncbi:hypothetical protein GCM10025777_31870 [Membranihabitans marinus]|uniref:Uncharacterized protein n=1 Tax=Nesterenkonia rhizosphaerae TaxID=1348272 RepID=A0ABP9FZQ1_9MICC